MRKRPNIRLAAALAGLGLFISACSGVSGDQGDAAAADSDSGGSGSSSDSSGSGSTGDPMLDFVQCLRDNGIDVADPEPGGMLDFGASDPDDPSVQAAIENCRGDLEASGGGPVTMGDGPGGMASPESLLAFVDCMREHGFDMPDPSSDGSLSLPENFDPNSSGWQAAGQECAQHLDGGLRVGDGSSGGGMTTRGG